MVRQSFLLPHILNLYARSIIILILFLEERVRCLKNLRLILTKIINFKLLYYITYLKGKNFIIRNKKIISFVIGSEEMKLFFQKYNKNLYI